MALPVSHRTAQGALQPFSYSMTSFLSSFLKNLFIQLAPFSLQRKTPTPFYCFIQTPSKKASLSPLRLPQTQSVLQREKTVPPDPSKASVDADLKHGVADQLYHHIYVLPVS